HRRLAWAGRCRRGTIPEETTQEGDKSGGRQRRASRGWSAVLGEVPLDLLEVVRRRLAGAFFPGEDADGGDAIELDLGQGGEEDVPVHLSLPDVEMLVDAGGRAGRVHDVAQ